MIGIRAIVPSRLNVKAFRDVGIEATEKVIDEAEKLFRGTTATWNHQPAWEREQEAHGATVRTMCYTVDNIYGWVSRGTEGPYPIPKDGGRRTLAFASAYTAKTSPGSLGSRAGGASGDRVVITGPVMHPGIKERGFEEQVRAEVEPKFAQYANEALAQAVRASGHAI